ncbi:hypothetical protein CIHG_03047 [Coccidioides immitis H538.4]|uniref:Uncharacterized protein n=2 Tax=Coccidioides immitis TaxID=5501 RepID=A0A0J8UDB5_COCIT|nr:hypothetical protein CIRG_07749 [Coccidioides immitis RMSCC 2394]KMU85263.1 hypothetical protein CIHG_03047 [Coccidioides immitis H538.4]
MASRFSAPATKRTVPECKDFLPLFKKSLALCHWNGSRSLPNGHNLPVRWIFKSYLPPHISTGGSLGSSHLRLSALPLLKKLTNFEPLV